MNNTLVSRQAKASQSVYVDSGGGRNAMTGLVKSFPDEASQFPGRTPARKVAGRWIVTVLLAGALASAHAGETPAEPVVEIVSQIHNAPEWAAGSLYKPGDRVVNLKAKPACAYQCVTGGTAQGAAPEGNGDSVKDGGGVVWKYLSEVDYTTLTGWLYDAPAWKAGESYVFRDYVVAGSPLCAYRCEQPGSGPSTVLPVDTGKNKTAGADGYKWAKMATIGYTSGRSFIPAQKYTDPKQAATVQMTKRPTAHLWNDAEYVAGERGENRPISVQDHQMFYPGDTSPKGRAEQLRITITAAPGESFMDRPDAPLRYDPAHGVAIRNPSGGVGNGNALVLRDCGVTLNRIQLKSDTGRGVGEAFYHNNGETLTDCIIQSDATGDASVVEIDYGCTVTNCLIIGSGKVGLWSKYQIRIDSCTIVSRNPVPESVGVLPLIAWNKYLDGMTLMTRTAIFGWASAAGHGDHKFAPEWWNVKCAGNATDAAEATDHHTFKYKRDEITVDSMPGTNNLYKVPNDRTVFVDPGKDWRIVPGSPLQGVGMSVPRSNR